MKKFPLNPVCLYEDFYQFLREIRQKYTDKPALTYFTRRGEERSFSYNQLTEQALALRESLFLW